MRLVIITLLAVTHTVLGQEKKLAVNITSDMELTITVNSAEWFHSGPVKVRTCITNGKWLSTTDGSLILVDKSTHSLEDRLGPYDYYSFNYHDSSKEFSFTTFVKDYKSGEAIVFGQRFDGDVEKAALDSENDVISSFPSITLEDSSLERGYMIFEGSSKSDCIHNHVTKPQNTSILIFNECCKFLRIVIFIISSNHCNSKCNCIFYNLADMYVDRT